MFEDTKKNEPEDIFAEAESTGPAKGAAPTATPLTAKAGPGPAPTVLTPTGPGRAAAPTSATPETPKKGGGLMKVLFVIIAVIVIIAVAAVISYTLLSSRTPATPGLDQVEEVLPETAGEPVIAEVPVKSEEVEEPEEVVKEKPAADQDKDGLSDVEEAALGTDPNNVDSDEDGLFDLEEVKTYGTNPLNSDTDGDTFKDGDEVKAGYNPNGSGKLFEVPQGS